MRPADEPVELSASALAGLVECPAKWFLEREAGGGAQVQPGAGLRQPGARDRRPGRQGRAAVPGPGAVDELMVLVDEVWDQLGFRTPWSRGREHEEVRKALTRFVDLARPARRAHGAGHRAGHARRGDAARRPARRR